jgi:predicted DNA-binding transcriptional regulator YafY
LLALRTVPRSKLTRLPATRMPIARMKFIYEAIRTERRPNCSLLAKKLEVSAKTVQRDIDYMRYQLNLPIEYDQDGHGFFFSESVAQFPSVHITESELVALLVARKAIEQYANTPFAAPLAVAFQKLTAGLDQRICFNWQDFDHTLAFKPINLLKNDLSVFETLVNAIQETQEIEFKYLKLEAKSRVLRRVQPLSLVCVEGQWYLRAIDRVRRDMRTFYLSRIRGAKKLSITFTRPAAVDPNEFLRDSLGIYTGTEPTDIVLRFRDWAATVVNERAWHPSQKSRKDRDGATEVKMRVSVTPELERWLWSWGEAVEVVAPLTLRSKLRESHQRAAARNF